MFNHSEETPVIINGSRGNDFKDMLMKILKKSKLKEKYINILLTEESLKEYGIAFTSKSASETDNYEVYEQLGDLSANKFIVSYMYNRFPQLRCSEAVKIVARLRIVYGSKNTFYQIAESMGFWEYISASEEQRNSEKKKLLEDTFEAFIGTTEYILDTKIKNGVGYAVVYEILKSLFDEIKISLSYEDLYDAKTRLKELFDFYNKGENNIGSIVYEETKDLEAKLTISTVYRKTMTEKEYLGHGVASLKADAQQKASIVALVTLRRKGITKPVADIYEKINIKI